MFVVTINEWLSKAVTFFVRILTTCSTHMKNSKWFCVLIDSNLLSVHVDSAFSVPDTWQIQMAQQYNYTASLPIPVSSEVRSSLDINIESHDIYKVTDS